MKEVWVYGFSPFIYFNLGILKIRADSSRYNRIEADDSIDEAVCTLARSMMF